MQRLENQRAIVTGGAAGIGRACAECMAEAGAPLAICDASIPGAPSPTGTGTQLVIDGGYAAR